MRLSRASRATVGGALLVGLGSIVLFAYLLRSFPYNGLYGIDSYAYVGQSSALLRELDGRSPDAGALFGADGLAHWPVGYHLHLMLGMLFSAGGIDGGRLITLALAVGALVLTYVLVIRLTWFLTVPAQSAAGFVAAGAVAFTATFTRTATSLMSDVPAMFWSLLALVVVIWASPPEGQRPLRSPVVWAAVAGAALGMAALIRYGSLLIVLPLLVYIFFSRRARMSKPPAPESSWRVELKSIAAAIVAFLLVLIPQGMYLLTHDPGPEASTYFSTVSLGNILSRSSTGPDGQEVFDHTMLEFYAVSPVANAEGGFLSAALLPLVLLGVLLLLLRRKWLVIVLLGSWWFLPALAYATTPYQAHRFALLYLPAVAVMVGLGAATGVEALLRARTDGSPARTAASLILAVVIAGLLLCGGFQGFRSVRSWQATHAAWSAADAALAHDALSVAGSGGRAVCFSACAPIDYYTSLPVMELYAHDEADLEAFIVPGSTAVVVPEQSLATQWAGEEVARRWEWLASSYVLERVGARGEDTIFSVKSR